MALGTDRDAAQTSETNSAVWLCAHLLEKKRGDESRESNDDRWVPNEVRKGRESIPQGSSSIVMSLYQASLGGPPWICRQMTPLCSIDSSDSV